MICRQAWTSNTAKVTVQQITGNIGAVIGGVDMRAPLPTAQFQVIRQTLLDHGVIFFRDQDVTMDQYWAFLENFGQYRLKAVGLK
ncbi:MAG: TauD/TfdA family dioxygenase [Novosphingobium sp.]